MSSHDLQAWRDATRSASAPSPRNDCPTPKAVKQVWSDVETRIIFLLLNAASIGEVDIPVSKGTTDFSTETVGGQTEATHAWLADFLNNWDHKDNNDYFGKDYKGPSAPPKTANAVRAKYNKCQ